MCSGVPNGVSDFNKFESYQLLIISLSPAVLFLYLIQLGDEFVVVFIRLVTLRKGFKSKDPFVDVREKKPQLRVLKAMIFSRMHFVTLRLL